MHLRPRMTSNNPERKSRYSFREQAPHWRAHLFTKDKVAGVSCGCADVFGAREGAEECGLALLTDNAVPGTSGLPSLARLTAEGYTVLTF